MVHRIFLAYLAWHFFYNLTPSFILPTSVSYTFHLIISPNHFCELTTTVLLRLALFSGILPKWNGSTKEAHGSTSNCFIQARHRSCQQNNSLKSLKKAQSSNSKQEKSPTDLILYWHTEISDGREVHNIFTDSPNTTIKTRKPLKGTAVISASMHGFG